MCLIKIINEKDKRNENTYVRCIFSLIKELMDIFSTVSLFEFKVTHFPQYCFIPLYLGTQKHAKQLIHARVQILREISCIQNCEIKKPNPKKKMEVKRPRSLTVFIQWNDYSHINLLNKHFHQMFKKRYSFLNKSSLKRHCPKHVRFVECPERRTI